MGAGVRSPQLLKLVLPTVDALALVVALGLVGKVNTTLAVVYAVSAILALNVVPRARINPRLSGDAGWILSRLAIPLFVLSLAGGWEVPVRDIARVGVIAGSAVLLGRGLSYALIRIARARGVWWWHGS